MTIDEAIEILTKEPSYVHGIGTQSRIDAIKLGNEALKRVLSARDTPSGISFAPLPGETDSELTEPVPVSQYLTKDKSIVIVKNLLMEKRFTPGSDDYNAVLMALQSLRDEVRRKKPVTDPRD